MAFNIDEFRMATQSFYNQVNCIGIANAQKLIDVFDIKRLCTRIDTDFALRKFDSSIIKHIGGNDDLFQIEFNLEMENMKKELCDVLDKSISKTDNHKDIQSCLCNIKEALNR